MKRYDNHTHTHKSNIINRDSTNFENKLIDKALELDLGGISITDHANLSSHVDALLYMKKLRKEAQEALDKDPLSLKKLNWLNKVLDFKLGLGTEIYLVDREVINHAREYNEPTKFYHLVVVAKNYAGYRALAELSSKSWEESFKFRGMDRVPSYKDFFFEWASRNRGNIIISTACLGSEFAQLVLQYAKENSDENRNNIINFLSTMSSIFGDDFYIELQPSNNEEQVVYNKLALQIAKAMNIKAIITTDAHYLSLDKKEIHSIYLKSQDVERETEAFYSTTYLMSCEELQEYFPYMEKEEFEKCLSNSMEIANKIEEYDLYRDIEVPKTTISYDSSWESILGKIDLSKYKYISNYVNSNHLIDKTLLQQIEKGLIEKKIEVTEEVLMRLEEELETLWEVSIRLNERMSSYYLLTKEIVEIMWNVSLVGVSRGSAGAFYICYLLGITQINPIDYNLPSWRHLSATRPEMADIDLDSEAGQRANILELIKEKFGHDKVLNIGTFKTEGTASAIQTMCRGMGISTEEASYLSSLAPDGVTVKQALDNFNKNKECTNLIKELMSYEGLIENIIEIEGLCCGRSVHASGIYIYNQPYWECNAMMKATKGQPITQYDMSCSDYQGGLKIDMLTIEALDRIRKDMELLLDDGVIEWQGDLKSTYDKYIHPDVINLEDDFMWDSLCQGKILDAFQMDSPVGKSSIAKVKPHNFNQVCDTNALMRISCEGKQPIDRYIENKNDINNWYREMREAGLVQEEIEIMKKHLLKNNGVASTQEQAMRLSMDKKIAGFDLVWANKLRKAIAKAYAKDMLMIVYNKFMDDGAALGNRRLFLEYVWDSCIVPMYNYSFSEPHIFGYSLVLMQELNLYKMSPLHWKVSCLAVNAGDINDTVTKATDYGALAKAIGGMEKGFVTAPYINEAKVGFAPDIKTNSCMYGLGAINGINNDLAKEIISLRPYNSLEDFIEKCVDTKIVQPSKMYNLIKAGCFDKLESNRVNAMVKFVSYLVPDKTKLTTANIPKLISFGAIPAELQKNIWIQEFRKITFNKSNCIKMINKTQGVYKVPNEVISFFNANMETDFIAAVEYDSSGELCLNSKVFESIYKKIQIPLTDWLKSKDALDRFNYFSKNEIWMKYCSGSLAKWEMDSVCYYSSEHELDAMHLEKYYSLSNFKELPSIPETYLVKNDRTNKTYTRNKITLIAGTVVEKNKNKSMITLNTQHGIVEVKLHKDAFTKFDRRTPEEASWFTRGTKLIIAGFRRGENFIPKVYSDSPYQNIIMKIELMLNDKIEIIRERKFESELNDMSYA